ncbi:uncharacterized protein LAESUDRAFT_728604 [Laetiporus sulphureus 93-53]|uniref:Uncharacterized protein n=1 Tax=Laetiporus sulphureus 93-53 TaxID=1314785 RepID=A0A165D0Y1_9APHY|nr:uncharacterized protein LAESUDRAFT_728604 [Laetiporus sulphureus 93-53]KZT03914.1 hypothetical protein LAESUDRAFT_728604 [Laetiporus sulphureus 93-53]
MIIDDTPASPKKTQQRLSEASPQYDVEHAPPPAYPGPQSDWARAVASYGIHAGPRSLLLPLREETKKGEPAERRFIKAFLVAFSIWAVLAFLASITVDSAFRKSRHPRWRSIPEEEDDRLGWPLASDGRIIRCVSGYPEWSQHGLPDPTTSFELPLSLDALYLFSRGTLSRGTVHFVQDSQWPPRDSARVEVSLLHSTTADLEVASVCLMEREEGQRGIALLTPMKWRTSPSARFRFEVTVLMPATSTEYPLNVSAFETDLPMFSHYVDELPSELLFRTLSLRSKDARIHVQSVHAERAELRTTNGAIEGEFHTSDTLTLTTSNAHIRADVYLYHDDLNESSTKVNMHTSNAAIISSVNLISTSPSHPSIGGSFEVSSETSNGPLSLTFPFSASSSRLDAIARTSNAHISATVNPAYEGSFEVRTSNAKPAVFYDGRVEDPSGRGRRRYMTESQVGKTMVGEVSWGRPESGVHVGSVSLRTSNAPAVLSL